MTREPSTDRPILLFFYSARSGQSRRIEGYLAQVLQRGRNHDTFVVRPIAQEDQPGIVERFRIGDMPALLVAEGGAVRARLERPKNARAIETFLLPWLKASEARKQGSRAKLARSPCVD